MSSTVVNGVFVAYDDVGKGEDALLLVHGHPFNRSMWHPQVDRLSSAGWRVLVPDLRGYGQSQVIGGTTPLTTFANDIAALLDNLGIDRVAMGGLSMGGQIVMEFARLFPARLRAIVLAATLPQAESQDGKRRRREMAERLLREGMAGYADEVLPRMVAARNLVALPDVATHVLAMMQATPPEGAAAALLGRAERPGYELTLKSLNVPALIVVGDEDAFTTRTDAECMHELLTGSELLWMKGVGHMPNLERPEKFNRALVNFLNGVRLSWSNLAARP
jgi:pimeloyl-ACP methyl ester carboxylesterase